LLMSGLLYSISRQTRMLYETTPFFNVAGEIEFWIAFMLF
jgi:hypothetical protein